MLKQEKKSPTKKAKRITPYTNQLSPVAKGKYQESSTNRQYQGKPIFPLLHKHPIEQTLQLYGHHKTKSKLESAGNERYNRSMEGLQYSRRRGQNQQPRAEQQSIR